MENPQDGQVYKDKVQNKQAVEGKLQGENEMADCRAGDNIVEVGKVVIVENKEKNTQANTLSEIKDADQSAISSSGLGEVEHLHEASSMNLSDIYAYEKFGQDLLRFIEHGSNLENWHPGNYQDTSTESFTPHMQMENIPIQQCINTNMQTTSESAMTLTVLNSPSTDEASQAISFSFNQQSSNSGNLSDHDYCVYPKPGYSALEGFHGSENNSPFMQPEQCELGMDQEKLQRMKRRKEKNRECSRQFRLKQKRKEQTLMEGKTDKVQELESLKKNVEKLKSSLAQIAQQCCSKCPKTRMLLSQQAVIFDKENVNPVFMPIMKI